MKSDRIYLQHIREALAQLRVYAEEGRTNFFADRKTQDAVIRNFEVLGEAAKRLSTATTSRKPEIPWQQMAGTRDRLIHGYFTVKLELLWDVMETDLPALTRAIDELLADLS